MNKSPYQHLSSTFRIGALTLRNRIVMAPMSTNMSAPDGSVTPAQIAFYRARAEGGVGMITVEFCCVDAATGRSEHRQLTLETVIHVDGHQRLVQAIKGAGAAACLQLQHGGQGAMRGLVTGGMAVAPSDVPSRKDPTRLSARALTGAEIEHLIECYGRTAELGVLAGYDAFEPHGAHGYLLTSFLSPMMNHRDDAWGGDEARRLNFPCRVIERVKKAIGGRPLIYRLSADEFSPAGLAIEDMERIAPKLAAAGADVLHVSIGTGWTGMDKVIEPMSTPEGWRLPYVRRIREVAGVPVIGVGQIRSPEMADAAIARGDADLIALGRPLLADPEWVNKALYGEVSAIRPCTSCNYCVIMHAGETGRIGCAENPRTGHELDTIPEAGALRGQSAIVVGGGPGGMAAALMLDQAGFEVELFEARPSLGGGLLASAAPPFKEKLNWYRDYLERQLAHSGVKLRLGTPFNLQVLGERKPAIIIVAVGGKQVELPIPGIDEAVVRDAYEILMGDTRGLPEAGDRPVLVYGGGETGCETAEYLSERGHAVVLVSRSPARQLARSAEPVYRGVLRTRLTQNPRVRIIDSTSIVNIGADGEITLQDGEGTSSTLNVSCVMIAQGRRPDTAITEQLLAAGLPAMAIGDAHKGGRIGDAVHQAYAAVRAVCATGAPALQLAC